MVPLHFSPNKVYDPHKHLVDMVAKKYLEKASNDIRHFIPAKVDADGNCLYHSVLLLMNNSIVTTSELRGI